MGATRQRYFEVFLGRLCVLKRKVKTTLPFLHSKSYPPGIREKQSLEAAVTGGMLNEGGDRTDCRTSDHSVDVLAFKAPSPDN